MQMISKINRRRANRQFDHTRLRRQDIDAILRDPARLAEFRRPRLRACLSIPSQELTHPGQLAIILKHRRPLRRWRVCAARARFFVTPVRGHPKLCKFMHCPSTNLHLEGAPVVISHHGMQRLIAIGLGARNVVVKLVRLWRPALVD